MSFLETYVDIVVFIQIRGFFENFDSSINRHQIQQLGAQSGGADFVDIGSLSVREHQLLAQPQCFRNLSHR